MISGTDTWSLEPLPEQFWGSLGIQSKNDFRHQFYSQLNLPLYVNFSPCGCHAKDASMHWQRDQPGRTGLADTQILKG